MLAPQTILQNRYFVIRQLGQGGMGTVYEAMDLRLNSPVALKKSHFTDERLRKQFEREAQLLARLRHPAMTRVIDHFTEGEGQYLVMDYIDGDDLWERLQKQGGVFLVEDVLRWGDQLLDALQYLHSQDPPVIHRDIKPQNLKLYSSGQIILLDFGLAKGFAGQISRVTTSGSIFGYTPNYAPLEQIQGTGTGPHSDLYSLAATLYHLMTGTVPPDVLTRLTATTDGQPDPLRLAHEVNKTVPPSVGYVLDKAMAMGRTQRYLTAAEMRHALSEAGRPQPSSRELKETMLPAQFAKLNELRAEQEASGSALQPTPPPQPARPPAEPTLVSSNNFRQTRPNPAVPRTSPRVRPVEKSISLTIPVQDRSGLWWGVGVFSVILVLVALVIIDWSSTSSTSESQSYTSTNYNESYSSTTGSTSTANNSNVYSTSSTTDLSGTVWGDTRPLYEFRAGNVAVFKGNSTIQYGTWSQKGSQVYVTINSKTNWLGFKIVGTMTGGRIEYTRTWEDGVKENNLSMTKM